MLIYKDDRRGKNRRKQGGLRAGRQGIPVPRAALSHVGELLRHLYRRIVRGVLHGDA